MRAPVALAAVLLRPRPRGRGDRRTRSPCTAIEVARIIHVGAPSADAFVVGKVVSVEKHPDADKLSVCEVDAGEGQADDRLRGANVAAGQTVPVALPGAVMPDGDEARARRSCAASTSDGMILSEAELEIGDDARRDRRSRRRSRCLEPRSRR